jgi:uncharacterized membrane protein YeaQ/YmgE (transglycosylase-associated protein family)
LFSASNDRLRIRRFHGGARQIVRHPTARRDAQQGIILNIVVGIVGAAIAGFLGGGSINQAITVGTFLWSLLGAVVLLAIVNLFTRKSVR